MFKVGDVVRCVHGADGKLLTGAQYVVQKSYEDEFGDRYVRLDGPGGGWDQRRFVLASEAPGPMTLDEYQTAALRSADMGLAPEMLLLKNALGLAGESGEVADHIKKHVFHGHPLDVEHIKKELGDILWYIAAKADSLGFTLSEIGQANIDKLLKRYPNGFSVEASLNRND